MGSLPVRAGCSAGLCCSWICLLTLSCHSAPPIAARAPKRPIVSRPHTPAHESHPTRVRSVRTSLELTLPNRAHWTVDDEHERWLVARHPATSSELRLRTWVAPRIVTAEDCERQARLWRRQIPLTDEQSIVTRLPLTAPRAYRGDLSVLVSPDQSGSIVGAVIGFGASVGRCYAVVFTTQDKGDGAEDRLARRLERIVDDVLTTVRVLDVEDRGSGLRPER